MKQIISFGLAVCFSFMLFVVMHLLIDSDAIAKPVAENTIIDISMNYKDTPIEPIKRPPPPKFEPPKEQPTLLKTKTSKPVLEPIKVAIATGGVAGFVQSIKPGIPPNGLVGLAPIGETGSSELAPRVRIEPMYPPKAARDGKQGFVILSFDISPQGEPINIVVVDSDPRGYFEQSAKKALRKWQYSPKREEGVAVAVLNQNIKLEFKLEG